MTDEARAAALCDNIEMLYGPPMSVISNALRGCIVAAPGHDLLIGDYAAIEARALGWLCGSEKILDTFRNNLDPYCVAGEDIYKRPIDKKKDPFERQVGKTVVLFCGYQGAVGAFQAAAKQFGIIMPDKEASAIVKQWREANPEVVDYWADVEHGAIDAVRRRGERIPVGPAGRQVVFLVKGSFLLARLPSGRVLSYPYPRLVPYVWIRKEVTSSALNERGEIEVTTSSISKRVPDSELGRWERHGWEQNGEPGPALHYKYVDPTTKSWIEGPTYGGSLVENIDQAICRDLLAGAILRLEAAAYPVVMHVHDEAVSEVREGWGSLNEFLGLMSEVPLWARDFPITAEGARVKRYRK